MLGKKQNNKTLNFLRVQRVIFVLCLMLSSACSSPSKFPGGEDEIGFGFRIDWDVFESGTYTFIDQKNRRIGGTRLGNRYVTPLDLKIRLKNGEEFHRSIDVVKLLADLKENPNLPSIRNSKFGGRIYIEIQVGNKLILNFLVIQYEEKHALSSTRWKYEIFNEVLVEGV